MPKKKNHNEEARKKSTSIKMHEKCYDIRENEEKRKIIRKRIVRTILEGVSKYANISTLGGNPTLRSLENVTPIDVNSTTTNDMYRWSSMFMTTYFTPDTQTDLGL